MMSEPTVAEMVAAGQCPHEETRPTPYYRELFCFQCEGFVDVVTGELAPDASERVPFDDEIDATRDLPFTHQRWSDLMADAVVLAMGNPNRPTVRAIWRAWRERVKAKERGGW